MVIDNIISFKRKEELYQTGLNVLISWIRDLLKRVDWNPDRHMTFWLLINSHHPTPLFHPALVCTGLLVKHCKHTQFHTHSHWRTDTLHKRALTHTLTQLNTLSHV